MHAGKKEITHVKKKSHLFARGKETWLTMRVLLLIQKIKIITDTEIVKRTAKTTVSDTPTITARSLPVESKK